MRFSTLSIACALQLLTSTATAQKNKTTKPTAVSLWLPWLDLVLYQSLQASVINAQPNATIYEISCPSSTASSNRTALCNLKDPETVTAAPTMVAASFILSGTTEVWNCSYSKRKGPKTCNIDQQASMATMIPGSPGESGPLMLQANTVFAAADITSSPVTVTAGPQSTTATPPATSATTSGSTASSAKPTSGAISTVKGGKAVLGAVGAAFVAVVAGMM